MTHIIRRSAAWLLAAALLLPCSIASAAADAVPRDVLAPGGRLRVGLYPGTPTSILPDALGGPRGVGYDLGRALADKLGVPYEPVVFARNAEVLEAVKTGAVDAAFTNASPARARVMDFGPFYLESELGYLVPPGSTLASLAEVDSAGRRVGVTEGSSSDAALSRDLKLGSVVRVANINLVAGMMSAGQLDVFATNKATLFQMAEKLPGAKVLDGQWGVERHAIAIPKGREQGLDFIREFTEQAKAQGLVDAAIARSGLRAASTAK